MSEDLTPTVKKHSPLVTKLVLVVVAMVAFVFLVLVPFYDEFCQAIGIGVRTADYVKEAQQLKSESEVAGEVDKSRIIKVQFVASNNADISWEFRPVVTEMRVHPGALNKMSYYVKNTTGKDMVGQAVHSVAPSVGGLYFHKTECFCFTQQPLKHGEEKEMPLAFVIDKELPKEIKTLTIAYTMFNANANKK